MTESEYDLSLATDIVPIPRPCDVPPTLHSQTANFPSKVRNALAAMEAVELLPQIPGFEIQHELGRGGMGVVYLARQTGLNRFVALKMILAGAFASPQARQRFLAEAEAIAQLHHPGIVQVYEVGSFQEQPFFALEFIAGGSLAEYLQGKPQPPRQAAELVAFLATAVQAAHDKGIIHRDLKPANILLDCHVTKDGPQENDTLPTPFEQEPAAIISPKITDFGLAKQIERGEGMTASGAILGTPSYMAPEQAEGKVKQLGPATDVYALGAIFYEMLTGRAPFRAASAMETMLQVMRDEVVPPQKLQSGTPADLETICLKCLEKDPAKRYSSAAALATDLGRWLRGEPILARPAGALERFAKWARRKPALAALLATVFLSVAGMGVGLLLLLRAYDEEATQRQKAETKEREAEHNYRLAKRAVDDLYGEIMDTPLFLQDHMREARRVLLQKTLPYYRQFSDTHGDDPEVQSWAGNNQYRVAEITANIGSKEDACQAYRQAIAHYQRLSRAEPTQAKWRYALARAHASLGTLETHLSLISQAWSDFQQAYDLYNLLLKHDALTSEQRATTRSEYAQLLNNMGRLHRQSGKAAEGIRFITEGKDLLENLVTLHPQQLNHQDALAEIWGTLAAIHHDARNWSDAIRHNEEARRLRAGLVEAAPRWSGYQAKLAETCTELCVTYRQNRQFSEALACGRQALQLREKIAATYPEVLEYQEGVASACQALGNLHTSLRQWEDALRTMEQAGTIFEKLSSAYPKEQKYLANLGACYTNRGFVERSRKAPDQALSWQTKAIAILNTAAAREPRNPYHQAALCTAYQGRAKTLEELGRAGEAVADWEMVLRTNQNERWTQNLRIGHARSLALAGRFSEALNAAQTLRKSPGQPGRNLHDLARVYVLCAAATTVVMERHHLLAEAFDLVKQTQIKGSYKDPERLKELDQEGDFDLLRQLPAFQEWRKQLGADRPLSSSTAP